MALAARAGYVMCSCTRNSARLGGGDPDVARDRARAGACVGAGGAVLELPGRRTFARPRRRIRRRGRRSILDLPQSRPAPRGCRRARPPAAYGRWCAARARSRTAIARISASPISPTRSRCRCRCSSPAWSSSGRARPTACDRTRSALRCSPRIATSAVSSRRSTTPVRPTASKCGTAIARAGSACRTRIACGPDSRSA